MVLPTMGKVLIGMSFFKKYSVTLDLTNNIMKFPDITLQLRSVNGKFKNKLLELKTTQKMVIQPNQQVFVPVVIERDLGDITGTVEGLRLRETFTPTGISNSQRDHGGPHPGADHQPTRLPDHDQCGDSSGVIQKYDPKTSKQSATDDKPPTQPDHAIPRRGHGSPEPHFPGPK